VAGDEELERVEADAGAKADVLAEGGFRGGEGGIAGFGLLVLKEEAEGLVVVGRLEHVLEGPTGEAGGLAQGGQGAGGGLVPGTDARLAALGIVLLADADV